VVSLTHRDPRMNLRDREMSGDFSTLIRGSLLNVGGAVVSGFLSFVTVILVARQLQASRSGLLFEGVAFFTIAWNIATLGADVGVIKMIPTLRINGRAREIRRTLFVSLAPVAIVGIIFAVISLALVTRISDVLDRQAGDPLELIAYLRVFALFVPLASGLTVVLAATRAFGTMVPTVVLDRIVRPILQVLFLYVVLVQNAGGTSIALAWALPFCVSLVFSSWWLSHLVNRVAESTRDQESPSTSYRERAVGFWRFAAPRALASLLQTLIVWLDTLFLGALRSAHEAGIYTAATRFIVLGTALLGSVIQAVGPQISHLLAMERRDRAEALYQRTTALLTTLSWPIYISLAIFAPVALSVLGSDFAGGEAALVILSLAMLVSIATGPVDWVLLMAGKSSWNLANVAGALVINVVLNLLLIPRLGMEGAAIAWAASLLVNNVVPALQVWLLLDLAPFGSNFMLAAVGSTVCFGLFGLAGRLVLGASIHSAVVSLGLGGLVYLLFLRRFGSRFLFTRSELAFFRSSGRSSV
jgi:O-antigen/teichoic acid export membrane protein